MQNFFMIPPILQSLVRREQGKAFHTFKVAFFEHWAKTAFSGSVIQTNS
tara:strand:+ start:186 stop:332 length:147 start_codon:yes stop_codon:yes gene_type:complete